MTEKTYVVAGVNWIAKVEIADSFSDCPQTEAATRAVEALYGMRKDIKIQKHKAKITKNQRKDGVTSALFDLLTDELTEGCRVGCLLAISNGIDEWFISSKVILENVGVPKLVAIFNEKYPDKKEKTY